MIPSEPWRGRTSSESIERMYIRDMLSGPSHEGEPAAVRRDCGLGAWIEREALRLRNLRSHLLSYGRRFAKPHYTKHHRCEQQQRRHRRPQPLCTRRGLWRRLNHVVVEQQFRVGDVVQPLFGDLSADSFAATAAPLPARDPRSGASFSTAASISETLSPWCSCLPVTSVQHHTERPDVGALVDRLALACSGLMYAAVPSTRPACVSCIERG